MSLPGPATTDPLRRTPWLALLLAILLNLTGIPLFGRAEFVLGGFITFAVARSCGPWVGMWVAALAALPPAWRWGNPSSVALFAGEAWLVGRYCGPGSRWRSWQVVLLWWAFVGLPVTAWRYEVVRPMPSPLFWMVLVKLPLNAVVAAFCADLLLKIHLVRRWLRLGTDSTGADTVRGALTRPVLLVATVPVIALGLVMLRLGDSFARIELERRMEDTCARAQGRIDHHLQEHLRLMRGLAHLWADSPTATPVGARWPEEWHEIYPGLAGLVFADATEAEEILHAREDAWSKHWPASWRPLLDEARQLKEPGILSSREHDDGAILLAAPFQREQGAPGLIGAFINLNLLVAALPRGMLGADEDLIVMSPAGRVVLAQTATGVVEFDPRRLLAALPAPGGRGMFEYVEARAGRRPESYSVVARTHPRIEWTFFVRRPVAASLRPLLIIYGLIGVVVTLSAIIAWACARVVVRRVTVPLQQLVHGATQIAEAPEAKSLREQLSTVRGLEEVERLAAHFIHMTEQLQETNRRLRETADQRGRLNAQLEEHLNELERRVQERTAELQRAMQDAQRANEAKSHFLAATSHEIRTPLNGVIGMADLLSRMPLEDDQAECVRVIGTSGRMLLNLINDILDLSKIEAGSLVIEHRGFSLRALVEQTVEVFGVQAREKHLALQVEGMAALPDAVEGDSHRLQQVMANLLGNALKFTQRGHVTLKASASWKEDTVMFRCAVEDTGIGIAPDHLQRLFTPFTQVDGSITRRFGGSGLGLAISRKLVELMGGEIGVESTAGVGSRFEFSVPLRAASLVAVVAGRAPEPPADRAPRSLRVLVVDDNPVNLRVAEMMLMSVGHQVATAVNGEEAVTVAQEQVFDLILMDLHMPGMSGYDAARQLRAKGCSAAILALSADALSDVPAACEASGMNGFISKPINVDRLKEALASVVSVRR
jgi:signal transduction histidine kinase/CheY-like chemotaxis protein